MELDLQRFYNINRRILMWIVFFTILYLLKDFFAVMFLTFILGFMMRKVAIFVTRMTKAPYRAAVVIPYLVVVALLVLLMITAIPKVMDEGVEFSHKVPKLLNTLAEEIKKTATHYNMETVLAKYVAPESTDESSEHALATQPAGDFPSTSAIIKRIQRTITGFIPKPAGQEHPPTLEELFLKFVVAVTSGTVKFFLAILLSFLIVLDYDHIAKELYGWRTNTIGRFFHEAAASVIDFSQVVGQAFQCQMIVTSLNASITCIGLAILGIHPLLLLTTIVLLLGLIPVLGVWISSVPIVLIAFNDYGLVRALMAVGVITIVHILEAYVFNPRVYAARFHLNPVIVLIVLLVGHELFGVWGMLLGIPVTHYVLNIAQVPSFRRAMREKELVPT